MQAAFIIRFHYKQTDNDFDWRYSYFRAIVLPRLLDQTNQDFEIAVWCNPWHHKHFLSLSDKIRVFGVRPEVDGYIRPEDRERASRFHVDFTYWRDVIGLPPYDLQIGLDSDDLIRETYVSRIFQEIDKHKRGSLHIGFQPMVFNLKNLSQYDFKAKYGPEHGSPFFALLQPDKRSFIFAYEHSHLKMPAFFDRTVSIPEGFCWFSIHDRNASTQLPVSSAPLLNPF